MSPVGVQLSASVMPTKYCLYYLVLVAILVQPSRMTIGGLVTPSVETLVEEEAPMETCRRHRIIHTITVKNCKPKRMLSWACQGACVSYAQVGTCMNKAIRDGRPRPPRHQGFIAISYGGSELRHRSILETITHRPKCQIQKL